MKTKLCKKCGVEKPLEEMVKNGSCKDGYGWICKYHRSLQTKKDYQINRKRVLTRQKRYRKINKKAISLRNKKWRDKNKETIATQKKQYFLKNKKHILERCKKYRAKNKKATAIWRRKYNKTEHGKIVINICAQQRRQRKRGLATDHDLTTQQWFDIVAAQNNHCALCGEYFPTEELTADHIHPLKLGGLFVKENIQAACGPCNSSKGTKTMEEWKKSQTKKDE